MYIPPPQKPDYGLLLCSGDVIFDGNRSCSDTVPLSPLLSAGGPHVKNCPGSLYDSVALIVPEDWNTLRALLRPQRWCPVVFLMLPLSTKAYTCCLSYVPNMVPLLTLMRDRGAVKISFCRFFGFPEACRKEQRAGYFT